MPSPYAAERYNPRVLLCALAPIRFTFDGRFLRGTGVRYSVVFPAVSGKMINGRFDYSAQNQQVRDRGPIPEGEHWIQPSEVQENAWYRFRNSQAAWGDFWLTIHPYPETNTYGRGGFFIHGGRVPGSAGCIDLSGHIRKFVESINSALGKSKNCYIPLSVRYAK